MKRLHPKTWFSFGWLAVAAALLATAAATTPAAATTGDGGTQSPFSLGVGSRGIALGRSFVSLADDASSIYWNPADLRNVQSKQIMAMYMPLFGDFTGADYTFIGGVWPTLRAGSFGLGFMRLGTTFDSYDALSVPTGQGNYSESQFLIGYAAERRSHWIFGSLATGVNFKIVTQKVDPFSSTAPGLDLGFRYIPDAARRLSLAVNLQDIVGADHRLDAASDKTYRTVMAGVGWTQPFANGAALRLMAQFDTPQHADRRTHFGAEYAFSHYVSLRAGYDDGNMTFGLGVGVSSYGFDYAYMSRDEAGSSHPVSFTTSFGRTLDEQRTVLAERRAKEDERVIQQAFERRVGAHRTAARKAEAAGNWSDALDEWRIVQEYTPGDTAAASSLARAREQLLEQQAAATQNAANQAIIRTRFSQGLQFFEDQNWARARDEWQAILAIDSTHAGARDYLHRTQEKIDAAVARHSARARTLERENRLTEAIGEWNNVQQYAPDNAEARRAIARIRKQIEAVSQDYAAAQKRLRIVTLYNDALQQYNQGQYKDALTKLNELLKLQPQHEDAHKLRALVQRKLKPLTDEEKKQIRTLYLAGMQHFSKDEYAQAIAEWKKILEIDPSNESVQNNIREAQDRLKRLDEKGNGN